MFTISCTVFTVKPERPEATMANRPQPAAGAGPHPLWFSPPDGDEAAAAR